MYTGRHFEPMRRVLVHSLLSRDKKMQQGYLKARSHGAACHTAFGDFAFT